MEDLFGQPDYFTNFSGSESEEMWLGFEDCSFLHHISAVLS